MKAVLLFFVLSDCLFCCTDDAEIGNGFRLVITPAEGLDNLTSGLENTYMLSCVRDEVASPLSDSDSDTQRCNLCMYACMHF